MGKIEINDLVYFKNIKIVQDKDYFNFSLDSVLLPNFVDITKKTKMILDMCTGNAPIPLILSTKTDAKIYAVELQKEVYNLAKETIKINKLDNQIVLINNNIKNLKKIFNTETFDIITCNPPYFKKKEDSIINENIVKSIARHEIEMKLEDVMLISKSLLKNEGSLVLVHRTDRLIEIIELMRKHNIEPKRMRLIYPKINTESNLVLIDGRKNGKKGLKILPPLYIHNDDNSYTKEVLEMFGK
ncbi:MAG: tRNA1(Val) (adenine(37)-N6)-methyltransferase [Mollicutes bacterium]|nr:tRNA1(Val) (adenine(37)-N6)-methyltransferase [Mollicutes bacterium]